MSQLDSSEDTASLILSAASFATNATTVISLDCEAYELRRMCSTSQISPADSRLRTLCDLLMSAYPSAQISRLSLHDLISCPFASELGRAVGKSAVAFNLILKRPPAGLACTSPTVQAVLAVLTEALKSESLQQVRLTSVELGKKNCKSLARSLGASAITGIAFGMCSITPVKRICAAIKNLPRLLAVEFSYSKLGVAEAKALAEALPAGIEELRIKFESLGPSGGKALAPGFIRFGSSLRVLNLSDNDLAEEGVNVVMDSLLFSVRRTTAALRRLSLARNYFTSGTKVAELVRRSPHLESLNLSYNQFADHVPAALSESMKSCAGSLRKLNLSFCGLSEDAVTNVCDAVSAPGSALRALRLINSSMVPQGVKAVAKLLSSCDRIKELRLGVSLLDDAAATELAKAKAPELESLELNVNKIGPAGLAAIVGSALSNGLSHIDISYNNLGDEGAEHLARLIARSSTMRIVVANSCEIKARGIAAISAAVEKSSSLETLVLRGTEAGKEGAEALASGVVSCGRLRQLDIGMTKLGEEGAEILAKAILDWDRRCSAAAGAKDWDEKRLIVLSECKCPDAGHKALKAASEEVKGRLTVLC